MIKPYILFRPNLENEEELKIAEKYFPVSLSRSKIPSNSLVIPRYSALPYYKELEEDTTNLGSQLINSHKQFNWIADFQYYDTSVCSYTFKTYFRPIDLPNDKSFVVKGKTNSRKHQWNTHCFAKDKETAIKISCELYNDGLIGNQGIIFREYEELKTFEYLINGLPVTNEFRFFFYKDTELAHGYYWSNAEHPEYGKLDDDALNVINKVKNIVKYYNNFYVVDIAQLKEGRWKVVELNAGEMSGLSMCDPDELYGNLKKAIENV